MTTPTNNTTKYLYSSYINCFVNVLKMFKNWELYSFVKFSSLFYDF